MQLKCWFVDWCVAEEEEAEEPGCGLTQPLQSGHQCKSHTLCSGHLPQAATEHVNSVESAGYV